MESFWPILASVASALLLPIAAAVGILITKRIQLASADMTIRTLKLKGDTAGQVKVICNTAVSAAQQLYKAGKIPDRKQYAMDMATKILAGRKIQIEQDILSAYIEAEVLLLSDDTTTTTTTSPSNNTGSSTTTTTTSPSNNTDNSTGNSTTTTTTNPSESNATVTTTSTDTNTNTGTTTPVTNTDANTSATPLVGLG